ncbi:MAG: phosphotransferase family protein [Candidatus Thorarchaeota archaeon]
MQAAQLETYLRNRLHDLENLTVTQVAEITDGWETEIFSFDFTSGKSDNKSLEKLVLRMYAGPYAIYKARKEFSLLNRLYQVGYPVPKITLIEEDSIHLGSPFIIMERIEGGAMWTMFESEEPARASEILELFSKLFHSLHTLDWQLLVENPKEFQGLNSETSVLQWIEKFESRVKEIGRVELLNIVEWLKREIDNISFGALSPVHNDFHPNNILIDESGTPFVIDWTAADVMDYRVDLAWTLILTKIYAGDSLREAILKGYEKVSQKVVEDLEFFEVLGALRRLTDILVSLGADSESIGLREGAAELIREQLTQNVALLDIVRNHTGLELPIIRKIITAEKT